MEKRKGLGKEWHISSGRLPKLPTWPSFSSNRRKLPVRRLMRGNAQAGLSASAPRGLS